MSQTLQVALGTTIIIAAITLALLLSIKNLDGKISYLKVNSIFFKQKWITNPAGYNPI